MPQSSVNMFELRKQQRRLALLLENDGVPVTVERSRNRQIKTKDTDIAKMALGNQPDATMNKYLNHYYDQTGKRVSLSKELDRLEKLGVDPVDRADLSRGDISRGDVSRGDMSRGDMSRGNLSIRSHRKNDILSQIESFRTIREKQQSLLHRSAKMRKYSRYKKQLADQDLLKPDWERDGPSPVSFSLSRMSGDESRADMSDMSYTKSRRTSLSYDDADFQHNEPGGLTVPGSSYAYTPGTTDLSAYPDQDPRKLSIDEGRHPSIHVPSQGFESTNSIYSASTLFNSNYEQLSGNNRTRLTTALSNQNAAVYSGLTMEAAAASARAAGSSGIPLGPASAARTPVTSIGTAAVTLVTTAATAVASASASFGTKARFTHPFMGQAALGDLASDSDSGYWKEPQCLGECECEEGAKLQTVTSCRFCYLTYRHREWCPDADHSCHLPVCQSCGKLTDVTVTKPVVTLSESESESEAEFDEGFSSPVTDGARTREATEFFGKGENLSTKDMSTSRTSETLHNEDELRAMSETLIASIDKKLRQGAYDVDVEIDFTDDLTISRQSRADPSVYSQFSSRKPTAKKREINPFEGLDLENMHRNGYIQALADARAKSLKQESKYGMDYASFNHRFTRNFTFSYLGSNSNASKDSIVKKPSKSGKDPKRKKATEMRRIFGNVQVADYYPGGKCYRGTAAVKA